MKQFNPNGITASVEELNELSVEKLRELHKMYPTKKSYLRISYTTNPNSGQSGGGWATYGSLASLKSVNKKVQVTGIESASINESKVSNKPLAPVRSVEVVKNETPKEKDTNENENLGENDNEALNFAKAKYEELYEKSVPKNKSNDLDWINEKIANFNHAE